MFDNKSIFEKIILYSSYTMLVNQATLENISEILQFIAIS